MLVSEMTFLRHYWHPVARSSDLADRPRQITLLGERFAIWRTGSGVGVVGDRCPHRGADLSAGWVKDDCIACPYHGWEYDTDGACVQIPHLDAGKPIPPKARVPAGQAQEAYGLVWVCLDEPAGPLPTWPEGEDERFRVHVEFFDLRQTSAPRVVDNALDSGHVTFVHRDTFSDGDELVIPPIPDIETDDDGFVGTFLFDMPGVGRQLGMGDSTAPVQRRTEIQVNAPLQVRTRFHFPDFPDGSRDYSFLGGASPVDDETSIYFRVTALGGTEEDRSYESFHDFAVRVQDEDSALLDRVAPDFPIDVTSEVHLRIDRMTLEYRRYLARLAARRGAVVA